MLSDWFLGATGINDWERRAVRDHVVADVVGEIVWRRDNSTPSTLRVGRAGRIRRQIGVYREQRRQ